MLDYLRLFLDRDNPLLINLEVNSADRNDIQPSVEPELGKFLGLLVRLTGATRVLEIGTGIGYSSIWLGEAVRATGGKVVTIDNHERTHKEVLKNLVEAGLSDVVEPLLGNAEEIVPALTDEWDIIFQDGGKYLYPLLYNELFLRLKQGGLLIADDTLFRVNPDVRKQLGVYTDEYNKRVFSDSRLYSTILPVGHGITVSLKVKNDMEHDNAIQKNG